MQPLLDWVVYSETCSCRAAAARCAFAEAAYLLLRFLQLPTPLPCPPPLCCPRCSFSPLCTDPATLKAGVAEGRANVVALARALFGAELPALRSLDGEGARALVVRYHG